MEPEQVLFETFETNEPGNIVTNNSLTSSIGWEANFVPTRNSSENETAIDANKSLHLSDLGRWRKEFGSVV
jgi:hypothetical protein